MLLKGWRLLEETCPEANGVPLVQHPSTGRKFSVATGKYMDEMEPAQAADAVATSAPPTPVAPSPALAAPAPAGAPAPALDSEAEAKLAISNALDAQVDEATARLANFSATE